MILKNLETKTLAIEADKFNLLSSTKLFNNQI